MEKKENSEEPRLEIFACKKRRGRDTIGNEIDGRNVDGAIKSLI